LVIFGAYRPELISTIAGVELLKAGRSERVFSCCSGASGSTALNLSTTTMGPPHYRGDGTSAREFDLRNLEWIANFQLVRPAQ